MKKQKAKIEINLGMDNFCYLLNSKGKRMINIVDFMKEFDGKVVEISVKKLK